MFNKLRNVFFISIAFIFSLSVVHANETYKKNKNRIFKFYQQPKNKKSKKEKIFAPKKKKSQKSLKRSNFKPMPSERPIEIGMPPTDCDIEFTEMETFSTVFTSDYGSKMIQSLHNIVDNLKNMYFDTVGDLDCEVQLNFDDFLPFESDDFDIQASFEDFEKVLLAENYLCKNDLKTAEDIISNIESIFFKNIILGDLFEKYILKNQILDAEKMYYMMTFDLDDEDDMESFSEVTNNLIIVFMRNNLFEKAENLAFSILDEEYKDDAFRLIVKYFVRKQDIESANKIIEYMNLDFHKRDAELYVVEYFARQNKISDFQKYIFSKKNDEFTKQANFILSIYQNDFDRAEDNMPYDYESILYNIVEILVSSNKVQEAEYLVNYFGDEWDIEYLEMFFVNAYLKNGNINEAARVRDEIEDPMDKIMASRLILAYKNG